MSDAPKSEGGSGLGFFLGFFLIIALLALTFNDREGIFSNTGTSTPSMREPHNTQTPDLTYRNADDTPLKTEPTLTPEQIENRIARIYRELDTVREEVREALLREPISPYSSMVELSIGNVREEDPDREYLVLRAKSDAPQPLPISQWYLESYVTSERAALPKGDRLITSWRSPASEDIFLQADERAYLVTGESPIDTSFHENICTGYLNDEKTFYPSLREQCPAPFDEMKRFGNIALDNDECYDFVDRLSRCVVPPDDDVEDADIGGACRRFIENTLNHNDCVSLHRHDPLFDRDGYWRIYLDERNELWRSEREIIRLIDEHDRVVDVIEY